MPRRHCRSKPNLTFLAVVVLVILALVGCNQETVDDGDAGAAAGDQTTDPGDSDGEANGADPDEPYVLRAAVSDFGSDTVDPATQNRGVNLGVLLYMWDFLLEIGPDGELEPGIATDWGVADDEVTWTFELRDDVVFHNGDPLTAHDVEFSLHRHMDDANTTTVAANLRAAVEEVRVVDDHTVEIITRGPQGGLPHILSPHQQEGVIFPRDHLVDGAGDDFDAQSAVLSSDPVGSGPFRLVEHVAGDSIVFEKVEDHWRATPAVDRLELYLVPDPSTQVAMLLSGEVDIIPVIGDQVDQLEAGGMEIRTVENASNAALVFVGTFRPIAEGKPTTEVEERRALSLAINREEFVESILGGYGSLVTTPYNTVPATLDIDEADWEDYAEELNRYDPDEAREILADAGYPDGFDGVTLFTFPRTEGPWLPDLAQVIAAQWAQIGVDVDLTLTDYGAFRDHFLQPPIDDDYNPADPNTWAAGTRFDSMGPLNSYFRYEGGVSGFIRDEGLDELIEEASSELDPDRRADLVRQAFERGNEHWIVVPLFHSHVLYGVNPDTVGAWETYPGWSYYSRPLEQMERP